MRCPAFLPRIFKLALMLAHVVGLPQPSAASDVFVPPPLQPWVQWVKENNANFECALVETSRVCKWPGTLELNISQQGGGSFTQRVVVESRAEVALPGGGAVWPTNVSSSTALVVKEIAGPPHVVLDEGTYVIRGTFAWQDAPRKILVPTEIAIVDLTVDGERVSDRVPGKNGELWLFTSGSDESKEDIVTVDALSADVVRRLSDGVPFALETRLTLRVAGAEREVAFGPILPKDLMVTSIASPPG